MQITGKTNMGSLYNHLILRNNNYPKVISSSSSSTPPSTTTTIKTSRLDIPILIKDGGRSRWSFGARKISPVSRISRMSDTTRSASSSWSWVETYIPETARPYAYLMRLEKYCRAPLILTPCLWSIALTSHEPPNFVDAKLLALFTLVERTKQRPLASGALTLFQGISFLLLQMILCFCLLLQVNPLSRKMWFASLVLAFTYPLMKRLTFWPQAYLGVMFNSFNLCGWYAVKGSLHSHILLPLCVSGFFWTMVYETIYSHQDKVDDAKIGVKSPALFMGNSTPIWTSGFAVACIAALTLTGSLANIGWPYYASVVAASFHLAWQILSVDLDSPTDCLIKFESNWQFGAIIFCGILFGRLYH